MEKIFLTNKMSEKKEPILRFVSKNGFDVMLKPEFEESTDTKTN